jgi:hypothetical protein
MYVTLEERCGATPFTRLVFHVQILKLLASLGLKQVWWQVYIHLMVFLVVGMCESISSICMLLGMSFIFIIEALICDCQYMAFVLLNFVSSYWLG